MKRKTFDCVEMKNRIQRKRQTEYEGLLLDERKALMDKRINSDPILGPAYRELLERNESRHLMVAEDGPEYRTGLKGNG